MYYAPISFNVADDILAYLVIESDTAVGCVEKMASLLRDVWSKGTFWTGCGGMMECLLLSQEAGHTLYPGAGNRISAFFSYCDDNANIIVGSMMRFMERGGDDFLECGVGGDCVFGFVETSYSRGMLWDDKEGMPNFEALADLVESAAISV